MANSGGAEFGGVDPANVGFYENESRSGQSGGASDVSGMVQSARTQLNDAWTRLDLRSQVEQHPLRTLAIALGAGYVLGGGLFSRLTGKLVFTGVRLGLKAAAVPYLRDELGGLMGSLSGQRGQTSV